MKRKYLIVLFFITIFCIIIYNIFKTNKINYVAIGVNNKESIRYMYEDYFIDYLKSKKKLKEANKNYIRWYYEIDDILSLIDKANSKVNNGKNKTITNIIHEANIITLSLGSNEIEQIINTNYIDLDSKDVFKSIDKMILEYKELLEKIRTLSSSKIIIIGYFNKFDFNDERYDLSNNIYSYAENRLKEFTSIKDVYLITLNDVFNKNSEYLEYYAGYDINAKGNKYIADEIIKIYKENKLDKR